MSYVLNAIGTWQIDKKLKMNFLHSESNNKLRDLRVAL